jgi:hypothetical protein
MAKIAQRTITIAPCNGTDGAKLDTATARQSTASLFVKRGVAAAVVTEQCTKREHLTMYLRMCALFVMMQIFATAGIRG